MAGILCIALNPAIDVSCDAERVQPTLKTRTHNQIQHPGGGGINVARVIAKLGGRSELLYLSGGAAGTLLDDFLQKVPAKLHRIATHEPTRIAFMVHELQTDFEYRFVPDGPCVSDEELQQAFAVVDAFEGDYVVASGSLPREAHVDTYARMAETALRKGIRFILDTSGEGLRTALTRSHVFLVKPSLRELELFYGSELTEEGAKAAAMKLVTQGRAENVVVSMGAQGSFLASVAGILRIPATHVKVRSAVGAGDSFVGAMTYALSNGENIENAFRIGAAAGTAAVMTPGTELCRPQDVQALYDASEKTNFVVV